MITNHLKRLTIGVKVDYKKELDEILSNLNICVLTTDYYKPEVHGRKLFTRYYIRVLVNKIDKAKLLNYLDKDFKHYVSIIEN